MVQQLLAHGGTSDVYQAFDVLTDEYVAIKITSPRFSQYFYEEANVLSTLNTHKNIVDLLGTFSLPTPNQELVMVLEKLDYDLQTYMTDVPFWVNSAIRIFTSVCNAISYCHSHHIAHLDIKPENILVSKDLQKIKLCDFGGSIQWNSANALISQANSSTPIYGAPETRTNQPFLADKADIWSLGVLLHVLFTRQWPFPTSSFEQSLHAASNGEFMIQQTFPKPLLHLLSRMLSMNANMRPTITEVQQTFIHHVQYNI
mgnify:CR=1 FL=1